MDRVSKMPFLLLLIAHETHMFLIVGFCCGIGQGLKLSEKIKFGTKKVKIKIKD